MSKVTEKFLGTLQGRISNSSEIFLNKNFFLIKELIFEGKKFNVF